MQPTTPTSSCGSKRRRETTRTHAGSTGSGASASPRCLRQLRRRDPAREAIGSRLAHHTRARTTAAAADVQFAVLCRRYLAVIASDRQYAIFLVALPLALSLLAWAVPGSAGLSTSAAAAAADPQPGQLLLVLIIGAALMGSAAAIRELVKERSIYAANERSGCPIEAYLASKVVVLSAVTGLQVTVFTTSACSAGTPRTIRSCCPLASWRFSPPCSESRSPLC